MKKENFNKSNKKLNQKINKELCKNDEPIYFVDLTEEIAKQIKYEDVIVFTLAESGAMGCPGNIELIININNKLIGYSTNLVHGGLALYQIIPWLEQFKCGLGFVKNVGEGWRHIDTGFGNHLLVRDFLYDDIMEKGKNQKLGFIYKFWKRWCVEICTKKPYIKEVVR